MTRRTLASYSTQASSPAVQPTAPAAQPRADGPSHHQLLPAMRCLGISPGALRVQANNDSDDEFSAEAAKKTVFTIVTSDLLIPGDGEPIPHGAIVVEGKTIVWVGTKGAIPSEYTSATHKSHHVPYMMPGLWDAHLHFGAPSADPEDAPRIMTYGPHGDHPAAQGARLAKQCWDALQAGYTSLRDCGGLGCEMAAAINDGSIVGPNVYSAGSFISQTAGHGDQFHMPPGDALLSFGANNIQPGFYGAGAGAGGILADGVDECRRAIRLQVRRGAKCIKIMATGGVMSLNDNPEDAQFSEAEMFALVDEANRMGRSVAAHCHAKAGIVASIKAGVKTIEHGSYADEECIDLMKKHDIIYVPTISVIKTFLNAPPGTLPKKSEDKLKIVAQHHEQAYKMAVAKGVTIAMGTDTLPGYLSGQEIGYAVEMGLSTLQAIKAATATAALTLGREAPRSGQIRVGYDADVLGLTRDPTEDIKVLQKKENVKWVWKGGKLFKGPNVGPWGEE